MGDAIISVEGLGKKYRIQHQAEGRRYVALRDVIAKKFPAPLNFLRSSPSRPAATVREHGGPGRGQGEVLEASSNRKSEIGNLKSDGSAGVPPATFGVAPKETIKPSSGGTPAEGNRDGRAPLTSSNRKSEIGNRKSDGSAGVSPATFGDPPKETVKQSPGGTPAEGNRDGRAPKTSDHSSLVTPPKTSGPCATFPSRSNAGKWWELLAGTGRGRAPY